MFLLGVEAKRWLIIITIGIVFFLVYRFLLPSDFKERNTKIFFLAPALTFIICLIIYPLVYAARLSFFDWHGFTPPVFVGLENFICIFQNYKFWHAIKVTLIFVAGAVSVEFFLGMGIALLLNREIRGRPFFRALFTLPLFVCPVALGFLSLSILDTAGPINSLLGSLGFSKIAWLSESRTALFSIIVLDIWQWTPFCFLVFLAGLQQIPEEMYEAAYLETSSSLSIFWNLTLPVIRSVMLTVLMLRFLEALKFFDVPMSLTHGGPGFATESYSIFTYKTGLRQFSFGEASALAFFFLIMVLILFSALFKIGKFSEIYE